MVRKALPLHNVVSHARLRPSAEDGGIRIFLVRHGESEWNVEGRLQGQTAHVELTERGRRQARALARHLGRAGIDLLLSSDLARAARTARLIADGTGSAVVFDRRLREQFYGELEGCLLSDPALSGPGQLDPEVSIGGGESLEDVYRRVGALLRERIEAAASQGHRGIALVTHGETIRAAIAWLRGQRVSDAPRGIPPNGSVTIAHVATAGSMSLTATKPDTGERSLRALDVD